MRPQLRQLHMTLTTAGHEFEHIFRWLSPWNFWTRQQDILAQRVSDTSTWLLKNEKFIEWRLRPFGTLLCYGPPGVGKSVLASVTVDHLQLQSPPDHSVLAAYCDRSNSSKRKYQDLLGSLLQQLVPEPCPTWGQIQSLYDLHKHGTKPGSEDLLDILRAEIKNKSKTYVVIDALDEWSDDYNDISLLITDLKSLGPQVSFLITSRPISILETIFPEAIRFEVDPPDADLELYIRSRFSKRQDIGFLNRDHGLLGRAVSTVLHGCEGL